MGLQMLALVKLAAIQSSSINPLLVSLICPFVVKVCMSLRSLPQVYADVAHTSRLFLFRLEQIAFHVRQEDLGDRGRWERAFWLVCEIITRTRRPAAATTDEADNLHAFSMITL